MSGIYISYKRTLTHKQVKQSWWYPLSTRLLNRNHVPIPATFGRMQRDGIPRGSNTCSVLHVRALIRAFACLAQEPPTNFKFHISHSTFRVPNSKFQIPNSTFNKFRVPNSKFRVRVFVRRQSVGRTRKTYDVSSRSLVTQLGARRSLALLCL